MSHKVEITASEVDMAPQTTIADRLRFKLDFIVMMLQVGRQQEAMDMYNSLITDLDGIDQ